MNASGPPMPTIRGGGSGGFPETRPSSAWWEPPDLCLAHLLSLRDINPVRDCIPLVRLGDDHMRRLARLAASAVVLVALGCSNIGVDDPTAPTSTKLPGLQAVTSGGSCTLKTASEIEAEITDLYFKNAWPDPN